ncbi:MAG: hypothetical protein SPK72_07480 [Bacteroidales bacterium]|nr:hypothetical protein [Bacteroidales bacterium]
MRRLLTAFGCVLVMMSAYSQESDYHGMKISDVVDACITMRDAVAAHDTISLKKSADNLRSIATKEFIGLKAETTTPTTMDGHLVFDDAFADSLANGIDVYQRTGEMIRNSNISRGQNPDGSIKTKTLLLTAKGSTKQEFRASGHQEIAVVPEAGGLVTMKIHVSNSAGLNENYDDNRHVAIGESYRARAFELPKKPISKVEVEIINCSDKDISFVIISN